MTYLRTCFSIIFGVRLPQLPRPIRCAAVRREGRGGWDIRRLVQFNLAFQRQPVSARPRLALRLHYLSERGRRLPMNYLPKFTHGKSQTNAQIHSAWWTDLRVCMWKHSSLPFLFFLFLSFFACRRPRVERDHIQLRKVLWFCLRVIVQGFSLARAESVLPVLCALVLCKDCMHVDSWSVLLRMSDHPSSVPIFFCNHGLGFVGGRASTACHGSKAQLLFEWCLEQKQ